MKFSHYCSCLYYICPPSLWFFCLRLNTVFEWGSSPVRIFIDVPPIIVNMFITFHDSLTTGSMDTCKTIGLHLEGRHSARRFIRSTLLCSTIKGVLSMVNLFFYCPYMVSYSWLTEWSKEIPQSADKPQKSISGREAERDSARKK